MANNVITIQKFLDKALDTVMATESKTAVLENGSKFIDFDFKEAGYVRIMDLLMDGLSDYYRANSRTSDSARTNYNASGVHGDGYQVGNVSAKWTIYQLRQDRGKQFQIDEMDNEETAGLILANLLKEFLRTKVVPEIDAYRFATIAGKAYSSLGNLVSETPNTTKGDALEITHCFNKAFEWLKEHEVDEADQIIFVSPAVETLISNTEEIYKTLTQVDYKTERGVTFNFQAYKGRPIVVVPSDRFFDKIVTGDNGYSPASGAKVLNYLVASKKCVVPVVKLNKAKVFSPEVNQDFDGYKANIRIYHDVIVPKNKIVGCYASVSAIDASKKASLLSVALEKASTANTYKLAGAFTNPVGMLGTIIWGTTAFTLGATATSAQLANAVEEGAEFTVAANAAKEYFALVDGSNKIIAVSGEVTLPTA